MHLRYWAHDLGYRGHWLTKSRQWSTTLGALRRARQAWREQQRLIRRAKHGGAEEPGLLEASWEFVGTGWTTPGDAYLAEQARLARSEARCSAREQRRQELSEV